MTKQIKFGKFSEAIKGEDRDADILLNGERIGGITAVVQDCGSTLEPQYLVVAYDVDLCMHGSCRIGVRTPDGSMIRTVAHAKRKAKGWIAAQVAK